MKRFILIILLLIPTLRILAQQKSSFKSAGKNELIIFHKWEQYLLKNKILGVVSENDCNDFFNDKKEVSSVIPMHIQNIRYFKLNLTKDNVDEYLFLYDLDNCLGGNAFLSDIIFYSSKNNQLIYDVERTNNLKLKFYEFVKNKIKREDSKCFIDGNSNYIATEGLQFTGFNDKLLFGKYHLQGNAPNCCFQFQGDFEYNLDSQTIEFKNDLEDKSFSEDIEFDLIPELKKSIDLNVLEKLLNITDSNNEDYLNELKKLNSCWDYNLDFEDKKVYSCELESVQINKKTVEYFLVDNNKKKDFLKSIQLSNDFVKTENKNDSIEIWESDMYKIQFKNGISEYEGDTVYHFIINKKSENEHFILIEKNAEFVGGENAMISFIQKNLNIQPSKKQDKEEDNHKINVRFTIDIDGEINDVKVINVNDEIKPHEEAIITCFQKMPKWKPAETKGKYIKVQQQVSINIYF